MHAAANAFLLVYAGLFPIVNPVGSAPIFLALTAQHSRPIQRALARRVAVNGFILLLGSLYVISGGILVRGSLSGTPLLNTALLGLGAVLASAIGTTGASALLIRPLLRANEPRVRKAHVIVFFIFVVSNCGGLLTPLGDPPLFLGFLAGVPFGWTLRLLPVCMQCSPPYRIKFHAQQLRDYLPQ